MMCHSYSCLNNCCVDHSPLKQEGRASYLIFVALEERDELNALVFQFTTAMAHAENLLCARHRSMHLAHISNR
jgi:hypothetical protein